MTNISILMPAYNAANTIGPAIQSIQAQSENDWELIVINDNSRDDTVAIVTAMARTDPRIRLVHNSGLQGAAPARNTGLAAANGRYIAFLDADDLWLPEKLTRQLALMAETNAPLCYAGFITRRAGWPEKVVTVPDSITYDHLLGGNIIGCLTAIYDTRICGKVPMPLIRSRHDFALWLQLLKTHGTAYGIPEPLAVLHLAKGTLSANKIVSTYDTWRMYRDVIGLSVPASLNNLCRHLAQRVMR